MMITNSSSHSSSFLNSTILTEINTAAVHQARTSLLIVSMYQQLPSWFDNDDSNDDHEEEDRAITTMDDVDNDNHDQQQQLTAVVS